MKRVLTYIVVGIVAFGLAVLAVNNPRPHTYASALVVEAQGRIANPLVRGLVGVFSGGLANYVANHSTRTNYIFFSTYHLNGPVAGGTYLAIMHYVIPMSQGTSTVSATPIHPSALHPANRSNATVRDTQVRTIQFTHNGAHAALPLYGIGVQYGVIYGMAHPLWMVAKRPIRPIAYAVPTSTGSQLAAYWANRGDNNGFLFIAPRGWKDNHSIIGADGSMTLSLVNPRDSAEVLTITDIPACQGCIDTAIGSYFPRLRKWAAAQDLGGNAPPLHYRSFKYLNAHTIAFTEVAANPNDLTYGIAFQIHGSTTRPNNFSTVSITLPIADAGLAGTTLGYFVRPGENSLASIVVR